MKAEDMLKMKVDSKIRVTMFYFESELASSMKEHKTDGYLKEFDKDSEYCSWVDLNGNRRPHVHINCIELVD